MADRRPSPGPGPAPDRPRAVVTGGSRGIGRAIVEALAATGASVVATARSTASLEPLVAAADGHGWDVDPAVCDVADEDGLSTLLRSVGTVDIVVANAGVASTAPLHRTSADDLRHHLEINTVAVLTTLRAVLPGMRERGWGRAVVIASTAGLRGAPYVGAYAASKHAAIGLVRVAASEVAGTGVTVNAVCPTYVDTDMTDSAVQRIAGRTGRSVDEARDALREQVPLGRFVTPAEVAATVTYLTSDLAAAVNGQSLVLDGGGS